MELVFIILLSLFGIGIILSVCIKIHMSNSYKKERAAFDKMIRKNEQTDKEREPSEKDPLFASI